MNKINKEYHIDYGNVHDFPNMINKTISAFTDKGYKFSIGSCIILMSNNEEISNLHLLQHLKMKIGVWKDERIYT